MNRQSKTFIRQKQGRGPLELTSIEHQSKQIQAVFVPYRSTRLFEKRLRLPSNFQTQFGLALIENSETRFSPLRNNFSDGLGLAGERTTRLRPYTSKHPFENRELSSASQLPWSTAADTPT